MGEMESGSGSSSWHDREGALAEAGKVSGMVYKAVNVLLEDHGLIRMMGSPYAAISPSAISLSQRFVSSPYWMHPCDHPSLSKHRDSPRSTNRRCILATNTR